MFKYLILLFFPITILAQQTSPIDEDLLLEENGIQQYVSLEDNKVYDIEIIVFAYQHPLPNYKTYTNKAINVFNIFILYIPPFSLLIFWPFIPFCFYPVFTCIIF